MILQIQEIFSACSSLLLKFSVVLYLICIPWLLQLQTSFRLWYICGISHSDHDFDDFIESSVDFSCISRILHKIRALSPFLQGNLLADGRASCSLFLLLLYQCLAGQLPLIVFTSFTGENMHVFERVLRSVVGVHGFRWVHCVISVQLL